MADSGKPISSKAAAKSGGGARSSPLSLLASLLLPANLLTLSRILAVPVILALWLTGVPEGRLSAALIFILAGMTDLVDGLLARSRNEETRLGAFLDPVADKILVISVLLLLVSHYAGARLPVLLIPGPLLIPAVIIVAREIAVSALRELAARLNKVDDVGVTFASKGKTVLQMVAVGALMLVGYDELWQARLIFVLGILCLYFAALLSLWTLGAYLFQARRWLAEDSPSK